jgi:hypothetical protein
MKNNGLHINRYDLSTLETSANSGYCSFVTATDTQNVRLKELELKRDILTTAKAMIDTLITDAIASPESDIIFGRSGSRASLFKAIDENPRTTNYCLSLAESKKYRRWIASKIYPPPHSRRSH